MDHQNGNILNITLLKKLNTFILKGQFWLFSEHPPPWSWTSFRFESHAEILRNKRKKQRCFLFCSFIFLCCISLPCVPAGVCSSGSVLCCDEHWLLSLPLSDPPPPEDRYSLYSVTDIFFILTAAWQCPEERPACVYPSVSLHSHYMEQKSTRSQSQLWWSLDWD